MCIGTLKGIGQPVTYYYDNGKVSNYKVIIEAPVYCCNILGQLVDSLPQVAEPGAIFTVIGQPDDENLIIRFWIWKEREELNKILCYADSLGIKHKYFLMSVSDFPKKVIARFDRNASFTAGSVLIPFKLRLKHFDFSKDFTLGPSAGVKFRLSHYSKHYVNLMAGMGITSVSVNNRSTKGYITEEVEVPALTPSIGFVFEFNNSTQAGIFIGWDYISDNENIHLLYHSKPWISFGLGYTLLSKEDNSSSAVEKKH
jgi:hypothetical protein